MKINPKYAAIVREWAAGGELKELSQPERRALGLIASGAAGDSELAQVGLDFVRGVKAAMPGQLRSLAGALVRAEETEKGNVLRWKYSDESPDRMGDIILQDGWELDRYKQNPVVLWGHAFGFDSIADEPIGRSLNVWVEADGAGKRALFGDILFAVEESERGARVWRLAKSGFVSAGSVGFAPKSVREIQDDAERAKLGLGRYGVVFERQELLEFSLCAVPANANALQQSVKSGAITSADADELAARRTERDWERYMRRKARSFIDLGGAPTNGGAQQTADSGTPPTETGVAQPDDKTRSACGVVFASEILAREDAGEATALALADLSASQKAFAASLDQFGARLGELARAITDLGGIVSAPRALSAQPQPAAPAATASRDAAVVAEALSIIETMRAPKRR